MAPRMSTRPSCACSTTSIRATVKNVLVIGNIGAIVGGLFFGSFSQSFGRRRTIMLVTLLALPVIYFWAYARHRR